MVGGVVSIDTGTLVLAAFLGVFALAGLALVAKGVLSLVRYLYMKRLPTVDAHEVGSGVVELEGSATAAERTLEAPFTGRECLAYEFEIEKYRHDDDGSNWHTQASGSEHVPFWLQDETGTVGVRPTADALSLERDFRTVVGPEESPPAKVAAFLDGRDDLDHDTGSFDLGPVSLATGDKHRFTERRLGPGMDAYVTGTASSTTAVAGETPTVADEASGALAGVFDSPFVVADAGESTAERRYLKSGLVNLAFGLVFAAFPTYVLYQLLFG